MDKKSACCGCGCFFLVLVLAGFVVGGYFGISFLHSTGKDFAARTFAKTIETVTEKAFNQEDRKEIIAQAETVAKDIQDGKIGLLSLLSEGTQHLEGGVYTKVILLAFKNHYLVNAEHGAEAKPVMPGVKSVDRLIYGLNEQRITPDQIASISIIITEHFQEKIPATKDKSELKFSSRRVNSKLSREDVQKCLQMIHEVCDLNEVSEPPEDFSAEKSVKEEILAILNKLKTAEGNNEEKN
ncbi:MAG: hypothetical protein Kow0029_00810 [Candidatus Rifleibacteriota bacterium]